MDIDKLKEDIRAAQAEIKKKNEFISLSRSAIASHLCPFAVGDMVLSPKGNKEIIASVNYEGYGAGYSFHIHKIKKNGEPYLNSTFVWRCAEYVKAI